MRIPSQATIPATKYCANGHCWTEVDRAPNREPWARRREDDERIVIGDKKHLWIGRDEREIPSGRDHIDISIRGQITVSPRQTPHPLNGVHHIRIWRYARVAEVLGPCWVAGHHVEH